MWSALTGREGSLQAVMTTGPKLDAQVREAARDDARRVMRFAAPIIGVGMIIEFVSHLLVWTPDFLWLPAVGIVMCAVLTGLTWVLPQWPRNPEPLIVLISGLILVSVVQHFLAGAHLAVAFVLIMTTIGFPALFMPVVPMLLAAGFSWILLCVTLFGYLGYSPVVIFPVPLLALVVASLLFISRRNSIVQSVRGANAELGLVQERARAEQQTRQAEYAATITAGLSHNLSNQLQVSLLAVEGALLQLDDPTAAKALLAQATGAGARAKALLLKLQTYTGFGDQAMTPVDLETLCENLRASRALDATPIDLRCPRNLVIYADADRLAAALAELIANSDVAIALRDPSVPEVSITVAIESGNTAVIEVADNGPGFAANLLTTATEPFVTTSAPSSVGLGLSFADGVARQHGGALSLRNRDPFGAVVRIDIPNAVPPNYEL